MDRAEKMRSSRTSPHVAFSEYLKLRSRGHKLVLVFEGRQCPTFYIPWIQPSLGSVSCGQLIARGKGNVLKLRDLIKRNVSTAQDENLYFVDRDYDDEPQSGSYSDVYVTPGYSIENELFRWEIIERLLMANFDIADSDDNEAVPLIKSQYDNLVKSYFDAARELHLVVYACKRNSIHCLPGDDLFSYMVFDDRNITLSRGYSSLDELLSELKIEIDAHNTLKLQLKAEEENFSPLDPATRWRGKFHLSVLKKFLIAVREARMQGTAPFKRKAKVDIDPSHPSLLGHLALCSAAPHCLTDFLRNR